MSLWSFVVVVNVDIVVYVGVVVIDIVIAMVVAVVVVTAKDTTVSAGTSNTRGDACQCNGEHQARDDRRCI